MHYLKNFTHLDDGTALLLAGRIRRLKVNYQKYLASYAVHGDPNTAKGTNALEWPLATGEGDEIQNVLETRYDLLSEHRFFDIIDDSINTKSSCDFWNMAAKNISIIMKQDTWKETLVVQRPREFANLEL